MVMFRFRAKIVFGLNVLKGKIFRKTVPSVGDWDFGNAESFIRYTVKNNDSVAGWELGNELCGDGVGTSISASQYANDSASLRNIVQEIYKDSAVPKPLIIGPGGFFDGPWFKELADKSTTTLDAPTHHVYNLGPGVGNRLIDKILEPASLDTMVDTYSKLQNILKTSATSATAWVGESGCAWNSGHHLVTDAFVFSFWYLVRRSKKDQLIVKPSQTVHTLPTKEELLKSKEEKHMHCFNYH